MTTGRVQLLDIGPVPCAASVPFAVSKITTRKSEINPSILSNSRSRFIPLSEYLAFTRWRNTSLVYADGMSDNRPVALVTGGAKRVGRGIALGLGKAGYDVAITYLHSEKEGESLVKEIEGMGRRGAAIQADLTKPAEASRKIRIAFEKTFGRLDVLVNNASIYEASGLRETSIEQMNRFQAVHVQSPLLLAREFEGMLRRARGHIVNMVDLMAERPGPEFLAYAASKAGLLCLTQGLARALSPEVTVNGISPGAVEWPKDYPESEQAKYLKRVPLGRVGTPEEVAETVLFLTRPGGYITGQIVRLDGGRSIT